MPLTQTGVVHDLSALLRMRRTLAQSRRLARERFLQAIGAEVSPVSITQFSLRNPRPGSLRARDLSINSVTDALQLEQHEVLAESITQGTTDLSVYFD